MLFNSYEFILVFLPVTGLVFFLLGRFRLHELAIAWLVCASLFFYGWWAPAYLILLIASIAINYFLGMRLQRNANSGGYIVYSKLWLTAGVLINIGILGYFKYANFFINNINQLFGENIYLAKIVLPLAISFFTFQQIAFLVDAYKGLIKDLSWLHYALFIVFFPQLIAGPIVHHSFVLPQFAKDETFSPRTKNIVIGISIFVLGLLKKVIFADSVAVYATAVFDAADSGSVVTFSEAWLGALAYTCQIYFDFSGYSDMAIGLGRIFGVNLPINFNSPYKSVNIIEFWRRWHITLSTFLRDYLYIPLGGNRQGTGRRYVNLMAVMVLGGLWHGAGWNFLLWGGLHGVYLMVNHGWRALRGKRVSGRIPAIVASSALTLLVVIIAWVPFRAATLSGALSLLKSMSGMNGLTLPQWLMGAPLTKELAGRNSLEYSGAVNLAPADGFLAVILLLLIACLLPNTQELMGRYMSPEYYRIREQLGRLRALEWQPNLVWAAAISCGFIWVMMLLGRPTEFLYFQF